MLELVTTDDWECLLRDGKVIAEGHSLAAFQVLDALGLMHVDTYIESGDDDGEAWWDWRNSVEEE